MKKGTLNLFITIISATILFFLAQTVQAMTYYMPVGGDSVLGEIQYTRVLRGDSLESVSREYSLGYNELVAANRQINPRRYLRLNQRLTIPTQFVLPNVTHEGIVVNLAEMRLYYFPKDERYTMTFPVGIGKIGKTIPLGKTAVKRKKQNPNWYPTENIRAFNEQQGVFLPKFIGPGPDNPLGPYAIYLNVPQYLIHSTIYPSSIGKRSSFGCIRMYEEDVEQLFRRVGSDVPVHVINQPVKLGWHQNKLFIEVHPMLREHHFHEGQSLMSHVKEILAKSEYQNIAIDWKVIRHAVRVKNGMPEVIARKS